MLLIKLLSLTVIIYYTVVIAIKIREGIVMPPANFPPALRNYMILLRWKEKWEKLRWPLTIIGAFSIPTILLFTN